MESKDNKGAETAQRYFDKLRRNAGQEARRRFVTRLIVYPMLFVLSNGSFILLAWLIGLLQVLKHQDGIVFLIRVILFIAAYCGYLFGIAVVCEKLAKKLGTPWLFSNKQ